jgi:hypothetical protein
MLQSMHGDRLALCCHPTPMLMCVPCQEVQQAMFQDVLLAVQTCDGCAGQVSRVRASVSAAPGPDAVVPVLQAACVLEGRGVPGQGGRAGATTAEEVGGVEGVVGRAHMHSTARGAPSTRASSRPPHTACRPYAPALPQSNPRRQQVLSEHKRTRVALAKRLRARPEDCDSSEGSGSDGNGNGSHAPPVTLECLPLEVAGLLTQHLDPLSLAALACSSVQMRGVALGSDAWRMWSHVIFPLAAAAAEPAAAAGAAPHAAADPGRGAWHRLFCERAAANGALVQQWHCRRVKVKGVPQWREPACCPAPRRAAERMASRFLTPHMVSPAPAEDTCTTASVFAPC